ncbi:hypothetical protein [Brachyspira innocens]|uniref:tetratricopeptide repeat protein n=1 Tax=Brachyspira innocens TaxID=13264 RepID=UPI0026F2A1C6|nr:hypothetical protein [Brachyspira innocens]
MNCYNFIHNMKADFDFAFLKKFNFETFEDNTYFYYDYIDKLKNHNKGLNIKYNIAVLQKIIDSYIDECAYTGDNESFENVIGSLNAVMIKDSSNIYARNKAAFLYYSRYIYDSDNIYYDIAMENINKVLHYENDITYFILALLYQFKYLNTKDNEYFKKALYSYREVLKSNGNDINLSYDIYLLYKSKFQNIEKEKYFDIAAEAYTEILNIDNENIFALCDLAKLYRDKFILTKNSDYYLKAVNYYMEISYVSRDINIMLNLGFLYTLMFKYSSDFNFYEEAVSSYKQAEESKEHDIILYNLFGYLYTIKYRITKNKTDFELALNYYNNIDNNDKYYFMGHLYIICYDYTKDNLYFNASLSSFNHLDTDETDILNSLAYLHECKFKITKHKEDFDEAMYYYNRAIAIDRDYLYTYINRFELYRLAFYYFDDSNYFTLIINDYETLFNEGELNNDKMLAYYINYNIGSFYYNLYADSLEDKNVCSKYNLKDEFFNKALVFFESSKSFIAISDLYRLKYIDEHNDDRYFDLALSYVDKNVDLFRYDVHNLSQRAVIYYEKYRISNDIKYFESSLEYFDYAYDINKYDKTLYYNLALLYHYRITESRFEDYKEAENNYLKAIELDSSYLKAIENLGFLYYIVYSVYNVNGIFNNSLSCFETVIFNDESSLIALEGIGDLYSIKIANNNFDNITRHDYILKSIEYYEKALSFGIGIDTIYKKLENMYFILFNEYRDSAFIDDYFDKYNSLLSVNRSLANKYLFILNNVMYDIHKNNKYLIKAGKCLSGLETDIFSIRLCIEFFRYLFYVTKNTRYALLTLFYLEYISDIERSNIDYYFEIGLLYYKVYLKTKNYEYIIHSFHCFSRVLDINSIYPECNYYKALILKHLYDKTLKIDYIENAFDNLNQSVKLGNIKAYSLIGDIYLSMYKKYKKDEEYLDKAISNYYLSLENKYYGRNEYEVYFSLGLCYYLKYKEHKDIEEYYFNSFEYYKKALNINNKSIKIKRFIKYLQIVKRLPPSSN